MAPLWQDLDTALDELLEAPPGDRPRMLDELSGDDPALRQELTALLPFLEGPRGPLDGGIAEAAEGLFQRLEKELVDDVEARHRQLGPYRLGERLGSGAMGRVYRAHRADGAYEQQVAIKIQRWELPHGDHVRRFEQERQILSKLDHPAITRLLDGGVTADGVPYLVMELVDGSPIDTYCRDRALSIRQRLALFADAVAAVQSAHGQLIIHRDIKPSNVMVNDRGQVKLLDFGVAKLLAPAHDPGLTETGRSPLTFRYASPEQLRGNPLGVASDVYSLGVLLYELVTERAPFETRDQGRPDPRLSGALPSAPSTRAARDSPFAKLPRSVRRDLDAITLRALEPEIRRRYATAAELATDLKRCSDGRPVDAMPPSRVYRFRKVVQRNRLATVLIALVVLSLLAGMTLSSRAAQRAERQRAKAQGLADFALGVLRMGDPEAGGSTTLTARQLLESSIDELEALEDPEARSRVQAVIGEGLLNLQVYDRAVDVLREAASLRGFPEDVDAETADILAQAALAEAARGELSAALGLIDEAITFRQRDTSGIASSRDAALGHVLHRRAFLIARYTAPTAPERHEVVELLERVIRMEEAIDPAGSEALARSTHLLGQQQLAFAQLAEGERAATLTADGLARLHEAASIRRRLDRLHGTATAIESLNDLALTLDSLGDLPQAIDLLVEAIGRSESHLSPGHPTDLMLRSNLAAMYREQGDLERAETLYLNILEGWRTAGLSPPPEVLYGLGYIRTEHGQLDDAERLIRQALALTPAEQPAHWIVATQLGKILGRQGQTTEARQILVACVQKAEAIFGTGAQRTAEAKAALAALDNTQDR